MADVKTLRIACTGTDLVPMDELQDFQGELKQLAGRERQRLRKRMTDVGFKAPVFCWKDPKGAKWILDGHQRVAVLSDMKADGWKIPPLPVVWIDAKSKREAKEDVLAFVYQYGRVNADGLAVYVKGEKLDATNLRMSINLPRIKTGGGEVKPEVPITPELLESHNFVLLIFDNELDWLQAQTVLGLKRVRSRHKLLKQVGLGRVLRGVEVVRRLVKAEGSK